MKESLKRVFVAVQTAGEFAWALDESKQAQTGEEWLIFRTGDMGLHPLTADQRTGRIFLSLKDVSVDSESVWGTVRRLQKGLWGDRPAPARTLLHLATQHYVVRSMMRLSYCDTALSSLLERFSPDEIRIPPVGVSRPEPKNRRFIEEMQMILSRLAGEKSIPCRKALSFSVKETLAVPWAGLLQTAQAVYLGLYDIAVILVWAAGRLGIVRRKETDQETFPKEGILLTNADFELRRQFDLTKLAPELAKKTLVWMFSPSMIVPFDDERWVEAARDNKLQRRNELPGTFLRTPGVRPSDAPCPTLVTPLLWANAGYWFNSVFGRPSAGRASERPLALLASPVAAWERYLAWRRLAYAARYFAQASQILRAVKPRLVVFTDAHIGHRAAALAARQLGYPALVNPHGAPIWNEVYIDRYILSEYICLIADNYAFLTEKNYPGLSYDSFICHDRYRRDEAKTQSPPDPERRKRVMIATGLYFPTWSDGLFVDLEDYFSQLEALVVALGKLDEVPEIILKPHPTQEPHELYLDLQRKYPDLPITVLRDPQGANDSLNADLVVMYNSTTLILLYAVLRGIPNVCHWGAVTPLAKRVFGTSILSGAGDSVKLAVLIGDILSDLDGPAARKAREKGQAVVDRFIEPGIGGISEALNYVLDRLPDPSKPA